MQSWNCAGECGKKYQTEDDSVMSPPGWDYLEITRRYRCGDCNRELAAASALVGMGDGATQVTDAASRGALPKATAHTILPPSVKG